MKHIQPLAFAALSALLITAVPAVAQTAGGMANMHCSDASMKTAHDSMMKMTDANKKAETMKEMDMAKDKMAKKDDNGCKMHMDKAMGMMK